MSAHSVDHAPDIVITLDEALHLRCRLRRARERIVGRASCGGAVRIVERTPHGLPPVATAGTAKLKAVTIARYSACAARAACTARTACTAARIRALQSAEKDDLHGSHASFQALLSSLHTTLHRLEAIREGILEL